MNYSQFPLGQQATENPVSLVEYHVYKGVSPKKNYTGVIPFCGNSYVVLENFEFL
jgi:hypothetical protein